MGMGKNAKGKTVAQKMAPMSAGKASQGGATQGSTAAANYQYARETTDPTVTGATSAPKQGPFVGYRAPGTAGVGMTAGPLRATMPSAPLPPQQRF